MKKLQLARISMMYLFFKAVAMKFAPRLRLFPICSLRNVRGTHEPLAIHNIYSNRTKVSEARLFTAFAPPL